MRIKTYVVGHVNEAYPLIKNDLGKDAFILKTKPLRKRGILGLFQKKQFEVVAAADDSMGQGMEKKEPLQNESDEQKRFEEMLDSLVPKNKQLTSEQEHAQKILEALKKNSISPSLLKSEVPQNEINLRKTIEQIGTVNQQLEAPKKKARIKKPVNLALEEQPVEVPKKRGRPKKTTENPSEEVSKKKGRPKKTVDPIGEESSQVVPKKKGRPKKSHVEAQSIAPTKKKDSSKKVLKVEEQQTQDSHQEVLKELSEVKELIQAMAGSEQPAKMVSRLLEKWVDQLRDQEVDEAVIQFIIKRVSLKHQNLEDISPHKLEKSLLEVVEQLFHEGVDSHSNLSQSFIALVGPTGVGKTTTIAKLAAAQVIEKRQKVGLLTTDTFRIAAIEQLNTYANILNAPFKVVDKAHELVPAMHDLKDCDIVYMDSAGRNYLEGEYIEEINQYLRLDVPQENYLVLSMTTRWRDMKKIVEQMKAVPIDKLILTKWDETTCYGVALNMVYHYPYPLSYLCLGQGVPDDIMKANPKYMAKKLLGVDDSETGSSTSFKTII
jgi:flagellar biosynthesis protein FlhF